MKKSYYYDEARTPNFNLHPVSKIKDVSSIKGHDNIVQAIKEKITSINKEKIVVVFDYYHGINEEVLLKEVIEKLGADLLIDTNEAHYSEEEILNRFGKNITDDRIMGVMCIEHIDKCFDPSIVKDLREKIEQANGLIVVYGVAATEIYKGDIVVFGNMARQEVLARYRKGLDNWGAGNYNEDFLKKEKRFNFFEGRMQEWHKRPILNSCDFIIDGNSENADVMVTGEDFKKACKQLTKQPFQNIPYFAPAVWGGHWAQKVLGAKPEEVNIGWATPAALEMLPVALEMGGNEFVIHGADLMYVEPKGIIGFKQFSNYGYKAPVIANYLDTWEGGNLSLQVHPIMSYCQEMFNADFGHHESYYMMDTMEDSSVYLGVKEDVDFDEMISAFKEAQETGKFDDTKYINNFPMKKHDHIYVPGGTIHASGKNTVVLELDIFGLQTFKLWDWGRIDFDGKPRPINIEHGEKVIQNEIRTEFVKKNLISKRQEVASGYGWRKEFSGTTEYEPFAVYRYFFDKTVFLETNDVIHIIVLTEGEEAIIESPNGDFGPFVIHYAEAVFIPAAVGQFTVKPYGKSASEECAIVDCYMDFSIK